MSCLLMWYAVGKMGESTLARKQTQRPNRAPRTLTSGFRQQGLKERARALIRKTETGVYFKKRITAQAREYEALTRCDKNVQRRESYSLLNATND